MSAFLLALLHAFVSAILVYFIVVNTAQLLLLGAAALEMTRHVRRIRREGRSRILGSTLAPRITVLAPVCDAEASVTGEVRGLLALYYPNLEIIVINDGSSDATLDRLRETFDLVPVHNIFRRVLEAQPVVGQFRSRAHANLVVVDKQRGGTADALNAGLNIATGDLVCAIDAGTLVEPDALQHMVRPFLASHDLLAAGGPIRIVNDSTIERGRVLDVRAPRNALAAFQAVEYLRAFLFARIGWNRVGGNLIIAGAFGLFRRAAVLAAGGYRHDVLGEDVELIVRMRHTALEQKAPHEVYFVPDAVAWARAPEAAGVLRRQRERWHRAISSTLWRHRRMLFNPRHGAVGMLVVPWFALVEIAAPLLEAIGLLGLVLGLAVGALDGTFATFYFVGVYGLAMVGSMLAVVLEEYSFHRYDTVRDRLILVVAAVLEHVGYRQFTVWARLRSLWAGRAVPPDRS